MRTWRMHMYCYDRMTLQEAFEQKLEATAHRMSSLLRLPAENRADYAELVFDEEQISDEIWHAISQLEPRQRVVLRYRFVEQMTLQETAHILHVTRERIRQIEAKALRRLKVMIWEGKLPCVELYMYT